MKRNSLRLLFIFLSIFGVASLVGTGFAVFVFIEEGTEVSAKEASVGLSIEPVAISGEFRVDQAPSKLVLSEGNKTVTVYIDSGCLSNQSLFRCIFDAICISP